MAVSSRGCGVHHGLGRPGAVRLGCLLLCLAALAVLPGCRGCRQDPQEKDKKERAEELAKRREELRKKLKEKKKEEEEKPKPDFEVGSLLTQPNSARKVIDCWYKPGHWTSTTLMAKTNNFDFVGELETSVLSRDGKPLGLVAMPYTIAGSRPMALSKGRPKSFESVVFAPDVVPSAHVTCRMRSAKGGRVFEMGQPLARMPAYQYHFVVLARWPQKYSYLKDLHSVKPPVSLSTADVMRGYYMVDLLHTKRRVPLPSHALCWTGIAYVLWDDADPQVLSPQQQQALVDWLHWGGQLIISGPGSLDGLRDSFLSPYLPAVASGGRQLVGDDFKELNGYWTLPSNTDRGIRQSGRPLTLTRPWSGVKLTKHERARFVPHCGDLLVERRIGRGRIVASAFRLSGGGLISWSGFDGFVNGCLLGRSGREFKLENDLEPVVRWTDGPGNWLDARMVCKLRYFTRDTGAGDRTYLPPGSHRTAFDLEERSPLGSGVAGWDDFNPVAKSARAALTSAARIQAPERSFVAWVVIGYILVLVPVNWGIFRAIGRVQWAWAAAPVIAVVCTVIVIRLAQLDIGFARALTEIAVVEFQADHPRAHVTRYSAMYTSLSTPYKVSCEDPGAQVLPFPKARGREQFRLAFGSSPHRLRYHHGTDVSLQDYRVRSNDVGMMHSEQMVDLGGSISLVETPGGGYEVINRTGITLHDVAVIELEKLPGHRLQKEPGWIRRNEQAKAFDAAQEDDPVRPLRKKRATAMLLTEDRLWVRIAWVDALLPGANVRLAFEPPMKPPDAGQFLAEKRNRSELTVADCPSGVLNLRPLVDVAEDAGGLEPGEMRLIGWSDGELPGLKIEPHAPQTRHAALVVAHLRYPPPDEPKRDVNTAADLDAIW